MKHFINAPESIVTEAIDAEIALGSGKLARLDGFPSIKVVVRTDWDRSKVAIVSGGGSGHEPSHAGFVGDGMLTAAVCGDIFASPSVDAVLAAILAVTGAPGCLLIVKSYTGDRLNFGLAAERARALGVNVEMVVVGDDIAIADAERPRGIAGTLFVHKVAGHVARAGASLDAVKAAAEHVARSTVSIGLSMSSCTIPGRPAEPRMRADEVELGLGIHGEPGAQLVLLRPIDQLAATMVASVEQALEARGRARTPVALLVNDLGGVPPIELAVATRALLGAMTRNVSLVFGPGRLMTSLDMKGISVSALPIDGRDAAGFDLEEALRSDVGPRAWIAGRQPSAPAPVPLPAAMKATEHRASAHVGRRAALRRACEVLIEKQGELDALDAKVGDGDTGTTFATAARFLLADLDRLPLAEPPAMCAAISERLARVMGGSSGILLAIFFAAMGACVGEPADWIAALRAGTDRLQEYGGARAGDRTMLDALLPAMASLEAGGDLAAAAKAAADGATRTASMTKARAGRASYVRSDVLLGVADPGAAATAAVLQALAAG